MEELRKKVEEDRKSLSSEAKTISGLVPSEEDKAPTQTEKELSNRELAGNWTTVANFLEKPVGAISKTEDITAAKKALDDLSNKQVYPQQELSAVPR